MKHKLWLLQIPIVMMMTFALYVDALGTDGRLKNAFLSQKILPMVRATHGWFSNFKFKTRGPEAPKNKVVIVEIDSASLEAIGRWPWHRNYTAFLIDKVFQSGAKVVGLDMVFSEPDTRVSEEIRTILEQYQLTHVIPELETDNQLEAVIKKYKERLVIGWTTENFCVSRLSSSEECPVDDIESLQKIPEGMERYAYDEVTIDGGTAIDSQRVALPTILTYIPNTPLFTLPSQVGGYFNASQDDDGYIRRTTLAMHSQGKLFPSLALAMARTGLGEKLKLELNANQEVKSIRFAQSNKNIPVTGLGSMEINFRGPAFTFRYIRALDFLTEEGNYVISDGRKIASVDTPSMQEIMKDAYVLIGVTALGVHDMRAFPFEANTAGVEGHAHILDNLLSLDMLKTEKQSSGGRIWLFLLMTLGAILFAYVTERLESIPALLFFSFVTGGFTLIDLKLLFENGINWNTSLFYVEIGIIFFTTMAVKYVAEERNKKFIRGAFAKYVAPAIVDSIIKDPTKLTVGGIKRDLTIMFSDIRSFTTFSEKMDAKQLAGFLNDYLGTMTDIVFECEGTLDKYIGDAVMAFWGAPLDQPRHAANACKAAILMQRRLATERPRFKQQYDIDVHVGIGINSGPVNVGNMGSERIFEYTVIGDHVNLASRLEGLTKYYGVTIVTTRFTFNLIEQANDPLPLHRVLDFVKVKGKKTAVELIQILEHDRSPEGLRLFEEGRLLYTQQQWDAAIEKFAAAAPLLRQHSDEPDAPCEMYQERCREFKQNPPEADWDGSWVMTSK